MAPVVHLTTTVTTSVTTSAGTAAAAPRAVPVLVRLSLAELILLTDRLGGTVLPFDLSGSIDDKSGDPTDDRLQERLAGGVPSVGQRAHGLVRAARDQARINPGAAAPRLTEIGLLDDNGTPVGDVVAAFAVLAAPEALLVLDLALQRDAGPARLRSWFAITGTQVVQLSTASGLVFELAWFDGVDLPDALARAATVVDDDAQTSDGATSDDEVGSPLELPFELFTDGTEAVRRGRDDLLAELVRIAPGPVHVGGVEVAPAAAASVVTSLERASCGRLRVLVTVPQDAAGRRTVGVVSWLRVGSGWRSLTPLTVAGVPIVVVTQVAEADLSRAVAPVLAQVVR